MTKFIEKIFVLSNNSRGRSSTMQIWPWIGFKNILQRKYICKKSFKYWWPQVWAAFKISFQWIVESSQARLVFCKFDLILQGEADLIYTCSNSLHWPGSGQRTLKRAEKKEHSLAIEIQMCLCACAYERAAQTKSTFCFVLLNWLTDL